jgi:hypothetical protein
MDAKNCSLTLKEVQEMKVFQKKLHRETFEPNVEEVTGCSIIRRLYSSQIIVLKIK